MNTQTAKLDNQRAKLPKKLYIATDGSLKSCVTGPLLELPLDFQAWPHTDSGNIVLFLSKAA